MISTIIFTAVNTLTWLPMVFIWKDLLLTSFLWLLPGFYMVLNHDAWWSNEDNDNNSKISLLQASWLTALPCWQSTWVIDQNLHPIWIHFHWNFPISCSFGWINICRTCANNTQAQLLQLRVFCPIHGHWYVCGFAELFFAQWSVQFTFPR